MFRQCAPDGGVALVTGRGARVVSGHVSVNDIVPGFDVAPDDDARNPAMPLRLLIASDVLSEGLSLRRAGVLIHLDLPWTIARLEQRIGRLRRIGSSHSVIDVYAIGPPVAARELVPVVRALQRKARLSNAIVGNSELTSSTPLLGQRLLKATADLRSTGTSSVERLRLVLGRWSLNTVQRASTVGTRANRKVALVLIGGDGVHRLVAVSDDGLTENPHDVLQAVESLDEHRFARATQPRAIRDVIDHWLAEQHGRELARLATEPASAAHAALLRALQDRLRRAPRIERKALGTRIEKCRRLVLATRGIGAERAMLELSQATLDLDALEQVLASRALAGTQCAEPPRVIAALDLGDGGIGAWVAEGLEP
jgi:hypothetical protein